VRRYRHLILDRDGVLNVEGSSDEPVTESTFRWENGSREALGLLTGAGTLLSVATNQSAVGRGLITLGALAEVHQRLRLEAEDAGARLAGIYFCPHAPEDGCLCRKPRPALLQQAIQASGIPAGETLFVGDALRDLLAARGAGVDFVLVRTGKGEATRRLPEASGVPCFDNLLSLAQHLSSESHET
jgi:D-glycero-D-manno-heptose 1,7-bisphosphate phosphatase